LDPFHCVENFSVVRLSPFHSFFESFFEMVFSSRVYWGY